MKMLHSICIHVLSLFLYSTFCELCGIFLPKPPPKLSPKRLVAYFFWCTYVCTTFFCTVLFVSCVEYFLPKPPPKLSPKPQTMSCRFSMYIHTFFFGVSIFWLGCFFRKLSSNPVSDRLNFHRGKKVCCELCERVLAQAPAKTVPQTTKNVWCSWGGYGRGAVILRNGPF